MVEQREELIKDLKECNYCRRSRAPLGRGFCVEQLAKDVSQKLSVNRFTILNIENVNTSNSESEDAFTSSFTLVIRTPP